MKQILRKGASWLFQVLVVAGSLLMLFIALTPQGRAGFHTALFLTQMLDVPIKPQSWFTGEPLRYEVRFQSPQGTSVAQIYRVPDGKPQAATLLSLGVYDQGFDGAVVVNLGNALARAGYVVMYQWSPSMSLGYRIEPDELENLVAAFLYLEQQDHVDRDRVGLSGFCVGASFALVAASDARIQDRVHFVNAFGPYFDAETLLLQAGSRSVVYDGERTPWEPDQLTMRVLANELIETVGSPREADILARRYGGEHSDALTELDGWSPSGRRVARLLDGVEPEEAAEMIAALPAGFRENLARVSPSTHVADLKARLLVMHDRDDLLVPAAESRRLLKATRGRGNVRYTELLAFDHVEPSGGDIFTIVGQAARLYRHMYEIIRIAH